MLKGLEGLLREREIKKKINLKRASGEGKGHFSKAFKMP